MQSKELEQAREFCRFIKGVPEEKQIYIYNMLRGIKLLLNAR